MQPRKPISHFIAGLTIAGILILISLLFATGSGATPGLGKGIVNYVVLIGGTALFVYLYGKASGFGLRFGDLFSYGFKATAFATILFILFLVIVSLIYPQIRDEALKLVREEMEKQPNMRDEDIETGMALTRRFFWVFAIGTTAIGYAILGGLGALLGAAITPKHPSPQSDQSNIE
jgi:hypothetical protein